MNVGTGVESDDILVEEVGAGSVAAGVMRNSVVGEAVTGDGDAWGAWDSNGVGNGALAGRSRVTASAISPPQRNIAPAYSAPYMIKRLRGICKNSSPNVAIAACAQRTPMFRQNLI